MTEKLKKEKLSLKFRNRPHFLFHEGVSIISDWVCRGVNINCAYDWLRREVYVTTTSPQLLDEAAHSKFEQLTFELRNIFFCIEWQVGI
jgi:hypothetical protein